MTRQEIIEFFRREFKLPKSLTHRFFEESKEMKLGIAESEESSKAISLDQLELEYSKKGSYDVISSVHGKVKSILVTLPHYEKGEKIYEDAIQDLLNHFGKEITLFIYINSEVVKDKQHIGEYIKKLSDQFKIQRLETDNNEFSIWIRDPFVIASASVNGTLSINLIEPKLFNRVQNLGYPTVSSIDSKIANQIAKQSQGKDKQIQFNLTENTGLIFHGGNVLVGDDFILIGEDYFKFQKEKNKENIAKLNEVDRKRYISKLSYKSLSLNDEDIKLGFQNRFCPKENKEIIKIGAKMPVDFPFPNNNPVYEGIKDYFNYLPIGTNHPFFHLDLFITLLGRERPKARYQIMLPEIINISDISYPIIEKNLVGLWNDWISDIASQFCPKKFEIHYVLTPLTYCTSVEENTPRIWYVFNYNNCIIENYGRKRIVLMPTYGTKMRHTQERIINNHCKLKDFDARAFKKFGCLGIETQQNKTHMNYIEHIIMGGSIHCSSNVLFRESIPKPIV